MKKTWRKHGVKLERKWNLNITSKLHSALNHTGVMKIQDYSLVFEHMPLMERSEGVRSQSRKTADGSHPDSGWEGDCWAKSSQTQTTKQKNNLRLEVCSVKWNICSCCATLCMLSLHGKKVQLMPKEKNRGLKKNAYWRLVACISSRQQ